MFPWDKLDLILVPLTVARKCLTLKLFYKFLFAFMRRLERAIQLSSSNPFKKNLYNIQIYIERVYKYIYIYKYITHHHGDIEYNLNATT